MLLRRGGTLKGRPFRKIYNEWKETFREISEKTDYQKG
jgi:hypothetical protein